jgi:hypothetical protein
VRQGSLRDTLRLRRGCWVVVCSALRKRGCRGVCGGLRERERVGQVVSFLNSASEPARTASDAPLRDEGISVMQAPVRAMAGNKISGNIAPEAF